MNIKRYLQADYLPIPLIAVMILTRFHHFGDVLHLPDASLAVFFFAGFYRKKKDDLTRSKREHDRRETRTRAFLTRKNAKSGSIYGNSRASTL
jgi:hypothetical protein